MISPLSMVMTRKPLKFFVSTRVHFVQFIHLRQWGQNVVLAHHKIRWDVLYHFRSLRYIYPEYVVAGCPLNISSYEKNGGFC